MKEYKHFILTRFNTTFVRDEKHFKKTGETEIYKLYDRPGADEWMDSRMALFRETKKSVLSQEGDFTWVISLDPRTPRRYVNDIWDDERIKLVSCDVRDTFRELNPHSEWVITSRLDNDDQLQPGFVRRVQENFTPGLKVIDVRFEQLEWNTGKVYTGDRRWSGSMFISLIEPASRINTVFCRPHGQVAKEYPTKGSYDTKWGGFRRIGYSIIEKPLAYMVCHGTNITNAISGKYLRTIDIQGNNVINK